MTQPHMPFEGNLIRAQEYGPCGCKDAPHWNIDAGESGVTRATVCPGRFPVEEFRGEDESLLGYQIVKGKK